MPEPLRAADGTEVTEGLYLAEGRDLWRVGTLYEREVTLIMCLDRGELPVLPRVRESAAATAQRLRAANQGLVDRYHMLLDEVAIKPGALQPHDFEQREGIGGCGMPQCGLSRHNPVHEGEGPL